MSDDESNFDLASIVLDISDSFADFVMDEASALEEDLFLDGHDDFFLPPELHTSNRRENKRERRSRRKHHTKEYYENSPLDKREERRRVAEEMRASAKREAEEERREEEEWKAAERERASEERRSEQSINSRVKDDGKEQRIEADDDNKMKVPPSMVFVRSRRKDGKYSSNWTSPTDIPIEASPSQETVKTKNNTARQMVPVSSVARPMIQIRKPSRPTFAKPIKATKGLKRMLGKLQKKKGGKNEEKEIPKTESMICVDSRIESDRETVEVAIF